MLAPKHRSPPRGSCIVLVFVFTEVPIRNKLRFRHMFTEFTEGSEVSDLEAIYPRSPDLTWAMHVLGRAVLY